MPVIYNTVLPQQFSHQFENKDNYLHTEEDSMMLLELKDYTLIYWNVH